MLGHITDSDVPGGLGRREVPEPSPTAADAVVVEVRAYAVNRGELGLLQARPDGWMPGQDVSGVVLRPAPDGSGPTVGTRVVACADQGGWSERVEVPSYRVGAIPDAVSYAQAASLPVAGLTALRALQTGGPLLGRRVLVTGASGGVGSFAVQLARISGAEVTAHVSGPRRLAVAQSLGADRVVTTIDDRVGPFDLVIDGVGGSVLADAVRRLAPGGTATSYGMASGDRTPLAFNDFRGGAGAKLMGFRVYGTDVRTFGQDLAFMAGLIAQGRLRPLSEVQRDWSETLSAVDALRRHEAVGKVILTVGDSA